MNDQAKAADDHGALTPLVGADRGRVCILVLGMHRSGTSALTRVLSLLGAGLPHHLVGAAAGNETGHWEPQKLVDLNDAMLAEAGTFAGDWRRFDVARLAEGRGDHYRAEIARVIAEEFFSASLIVLKDPRVSLCVPIYVDALARAGYEPVFVHTLRSPLEVAASLEKRDRLTPRFSSLLWLRYNLDAAAATRGGRRLFVAYDDLIADWRATIAKIGARIGVALAPSPEAAAAVDAFLAPDRMHHRSSAADLAASDQVSNWVREAEAQLRALVNDPEDVAAERGLDSLRAELEAAARNLGEPIDGEQRARLAVTVAAYEADVGAVRRNVGRLEDSVASGEARAAAPEARAAALEARAAALEANLAERVAEIGDLSRQLAAARGRPVANLSDYATYIVMNALSRWGPLLNERARRRFAKIAGKHDPQRSIEPASRDPAPR